MRIRELGSTERGVLHRIVSHRGVLVSKTEMARKWSKTWNLWSSARWVRLQNVRGWQVEHLSKYLRGQIAQPRPSSLALIRPFTDKRRWGWHVESSQADRSQMGLLQLKSTIGREGKIGCVWHVCWFSESVRIWIVDTTPDVS